MSDHSDLCKDANPYLPREQPVCSRLQWGLYTFSWMLDPIHNEGGGGGACIPHMHNNSFFFRSEKIRKIRTTSDWSLNQDIPRESQIFTPRVSGLNLKSVKQKTLTISCWNHKRTWTTFIGNASDLHDELYSIIQDIYIYIVCIWGGARYCIDQTTLWLQVKCW
jgi:hypothetical protein